MLVMSVDMCNNCNITDEDNKHKHTIERIIMVLLTQATVQALVKVMMMKQCER